MTPAERKLYRRIETLFGRTLAACDMARELCLEDLERVLEDASDNLRRARDLLDEEGET